jgi:hypothetical protein
VIALKIDLKTPSIRLFSTTMNKGKGILNRYVNPVTGGRINIFAEKTDKGEADACRSCGKTGAFQ